MLVAGQGYVGLTLAMHAARAGHRVTGVEPDLNRLSELTADKIIVAGLARSDVKRIFAGGDYRPVARYDQAPVWDVAVIAVPTPLRDGEPNLDHLKEAGVSIANGLRPGGLVILESTSFPGTTEDILQPILESTSGLAAGKDFFLGFSPERIDPGNPTFTLANTIKLISGIDSSSTERIRQFYESFVDETLPVVGTREAELAKLVENTFRQVNIALVNELAMVATALGIDINASLAAASSKPYGFMHFRPGPGAGGHCLPIDPEYLSWYSQSQIGRPIHMIELATRLNSERIASVAQSALDLLDTIDGHSALIVGMAYKTGVGDVRNSPSIDIAKRLHERGVAVSGADPYVRAADWPRQAERVDLTKESANSSDIIVLMAAHSPADLQVLRLVDTLVLDTQNVLHGKNVVALDGPKPSSA